MDISAYSMHLWFILFFKWESEVQLTENIKEYSKKYTEIQSSMYWKKTYF